jgi:UDP-N-acetylglucosamine:LPS N-acetylglucosamine transferase
MKKFEDRLCEEVRKYNKNPLYGYTSLIAGELFGPKLTSWFVMEKVVKGAYEDSFKHMQEIAPDVVVSTHWATNYYAEHMENKPYTVMYIPDAHANTMFRYPCDLLTIPIQEGYENGLKKYKRRLNKDNFKKVTLAIREQAYQVSTDKQELRKKLGHDDKFTVYMAEGGYGIGLAEEICKKLIDEDLPISVIMVCGKNPELHERLLKLKSKGNLSFYPYGFCDNILELISSSDLYLGKSGSGLLEVAFYGVPMVITHSANDIEKLIAEHYVSHVKDAIRIFDADKCVEFIKQSLAGGDLYKSLKANVKPRTEYGGEGIADAIFEQINKKYNLC